MPAALDPRNFDWGRRMRDADQRYNEEQRQNAMLDLDKRRAATYESSVANAEQRMKAAEAERAGELQRRQQEQQIYAKLFEEEGLPPELAYTEGAADLASELMKKKIAPQGEQPSFTLGPGQQRFGPDGKLIAAAPAAPERPQDPGYSEGVGVNPATGKPEKYLRNRWGKIQWTGIEPPPQAASLRDQLEAEKVTGAKSRVSGNLDALAEYYAELSNLGAAVDTSREGLGNVSAAVRASPPGQLGGRILGTQEQSVRNKINQMRPLLLQEIRQASAMGARGLDSNKELDFYLQAATDPSRDLQANYAALNVLSNAYGLGKPYGEASPELISQLDSEYVKSLPLITNDAEYKKLAAGTEYRDSSGRRWKKK